MSEYCKAEVGEDCISRANLIKSFLADCECESREEAGAVMLNLEDMLELIEEEPSVIPQVPNEDCISREDLLKHAYTREGVLCVSVDSIKLAPSVIPKEKEGKWIDKGWKGDWQFETDGRGNCWREYECSECGFHHKKEDLEDLKITLICNELTQALKPFLSSEGERIKMFRGSDCEYSRERFIGAINQYLQEKEKLKDDCRVTTVNKLFLKYNIPYEVKSCKELSKANRNKNYWVLKMLQ